MSRKCLTLFVVFLCGLSAMLLSQPKLVVEKPIGYQVGDQVDPDILVWTLELRPVKLLSLVRPDTRVVVLSLLGGAVRQVPAAGPFRGSLWCEDTFDDLAVQRAAVRQFRGRPAQFIAVAIPPVYNPAYFGYKNGVFLKAPDDSPDYRENVQAFVDATESQIKTGLLPFSAIYYDPRFRLAQNRKVKETGSESDPEYAWQGKLRWHKDPRRYGLPSIWLLGPKGEVLQEPFWGNDYDSDPPQVRYGFADLKEAIEKYLTEAP